MTLVRSLKGKLTILFALEFLYVLALNSQSTCILHTLRLLHSGAACQKIQLL